MEVEQDPIDENEYVLRRIHKNNCDTRLPIPIQEVAFKPTESDVDGISVYREKYVSPAEVAAGGRTPEVYYVARLAVRALNALNLTVVPTPGDQKGHAVIPELNRSFYESEKQRSKKLQFQLAQLASQAIVHRPDVP
jgi:hypothetical protein